MNQVFDGSDISHIDIMAWDTALVDIRPILDYFRSGEENITVIVKMGFNGSSCSRWYYYFRIQLTFACHPDRNQWDEMYATSAFYPYSIIIGLYALRHNI